MYYSSKAYVMTYYYIIILVYLFKRRSFLGKTLTMKNNNQTAICNHYNKHRQTDRQTDSQSRNKITFFLCLIDSKLLPKAYNCCFKIQLRVH